MEIHSDKRQGRRIGMAEKFDYAAWPFETRKWVAQHGEGVLDGSSAALELLKEVVSPNRQTVDVESFTFFFQQLLEEEGGDWTQALTKLSKADRAHPEEMVSQTIPVEELASMSSVDPRRFRILRCYENTLLKEGRLPARSELLRRVESIENSKVANRNHRRQIDKNQFKSECASLSLPLANGRSFWRLKLALGKNAISPIEIDIQEDYPGAYTRLALRAPDLLCHFLSSHFFPYSDDFNSSPVPPHLLSRSGMQKHVKIAPWQKLAHLYEEFEKLLQATYEPVNTSPFHARLTQWAMEKARSPDMTDLTEELELPNLRNLLRALDISLEWQLLESLRST